MRVNSNPFGGVISYVSAIHLRSGYQPQPHGYLTVIFSKLRQNRHCLCVLTVTTIIITSFYLHLTLDSNFAKRYLQKFDLQPPAPKKAEFANFQQTENNKPAHKINKEIVNKHQPKNLYSQSKNPNPTKTGDYSHAINDSIPCKIPKLQPFDPLIIPFIERLYPFQCENGRHPQIFELDLDGTLVQTRHYEYFNYESCCYAPFKRLNGSDFSLRWYKYCTPIKETRTTIPHPIIDFAVSCKTANSTNTTYVDVFSIPRLNRTKVLQLARKHELKQNSKTPKPDNRLNIAIFGLDGLSNMDFQRVMFKTRDYLRKLNAMTFDGYTKNGDNTLPNAMAFLTGNTLEEIQKTYWESEYDWLDDIPFIWKEYSSHDYFTAYSEDAPDISTFNYMKLGFLNPPTDFYGRPSNQAQNVLIGHNNVLNGNVCYGPRLTFEVLLKYMQNIAYSVKEQSSKSIFDKETNKTVTTPNFNYFQLIWANALFHDYTSLGGLGDAALMDVLKWFDNNKYLNDTVFIVMSDHGMRWGEIRQTNQGRIEERMPLLNIVLPIWFQQRYPRAHMNMMENKYRLSSHFDLHETLKDLIHPDSCLTDEHIKTRTLSLTKNNTLPRGISLFLPIPTKRDCPSAGIDQHWCVCQTTKAINTSLTQVREASQEIVKHINYNLVNHSSCAELKLEEITSAELDVHLKADPNFGREDRKPTEFENIEVADQYLEPVNDLMESTTANNENEAESPVIEDTILGLNNSEIAGKQLSNVTLVLHVTLKTSPGGAMFEASVSKNIIGSSLTWSILGDVSRLNMYRNQSHCVTSPRVKLYCFCKD